MAQVDNIPEHMQILEQVIQEESAVATGLEKGDVLVGLMNDMGDTLRDDPYLAMTLMRSLPGQMQYHINTQNNFLETSVKWAITFQKQNGGDEIGNSKVEVQNQKVQNLLTHIKELEVIFQKVKDTHDKWAMDLSGISLPGSYKETEFSSFGSYKKIDKTDTAANRETDDLLKQVTAHLGKTKRSR
tara:strand:- start:2755 stop:3312 length:558 start_codon:yes stop_codon:yes gene_type:complete